MILLGGPENTEKEFRGKKLISPSLSKRAGRHCSRKTAQELILRKKDCFDSNAESQLELSWC
jgi:hypothetical protein